MKMAESTDITYHTDSSDREDQQRRVEIREIQRIAAKDTFRIRLWRIVVTCSLLATAIAVTLTTYRKLDKEQVDNFQTAYKQFSRTISDATAEQVRITFTGFKNLCEHVSTHAFTSNMTWPFVRIPHLEQYVGDALTLTGAEFAAFGHISRPEEVPAYLDFVGNNYLDMIKESHLIRYGNLSLLQPEMYLPFIYDFSPEGELYPMADLDEYMANFFSSPPQAINGATNWGLKSFYAQAHEALKALPDETVVVLDQGHSIGTGEEWLSYHETLHSQLEGTHVDHPHYHIVRFVREIPNDPSSRPVAHAMMLVAWDSSLRNLLPSNVRGLHAVIKNNCGDVFTYRIDGTEAFYLGNGDQHEPKFDEDEVIIDMAPHHHPGFESTPGHCIHKMHVYPTSNFEDEYHTNTPKIYAAIVASTFAVIIITFLIYDLFVQRRNAKLIANAARSNAIVSSLFPGNIRDRLIGADADTDFADINKRKNIKSFLSKENSASGKTADATASKPLADLFLETTVVFADIVGFTAWSSVREPSQVFVLLETCFGVFDASARTYGLYKVETVGDCYVAVAGLPEPREDHAVAAVRFAFDISKKMRRTVKKLEVLLGPDTSDLNVRIGAHSGPVTAGVLRGERARFQLFGDTMNTCARIESNGESGRIHVSSETAALLKNEGKGHWIVPREDAVQAKGKGVLVTFWVTNTSQIRDSTEETSSNDPSDVHFSVDDKTDRLIEWNTEMLSSILKKIVRHRNATVKSIDTKSGFQPNQAEVAGVATTPLEEVREVIAMPEFNVNKHLSQKQGEVLLPGEVLAQLQDFITCVAHLYQTTNPFHNFEHASHVVMSVIKLMSRIVAPTDLDLDSDDGKSKGKDKDTDVDDGQCLSVSSHGSRRPGMVREESFHHPAPSKSLAATLHDHTYGITSDPLTQFACAFSALVHDIDHRGVPNDQLAKEQVAMAIKYKNRSIAEQNSLDLAWTLLMDERFSALVNMLCPTPEELCRFRQLVINSIMATDIMDKDLKALRNARWDKAFVEKEKDKSKEAVDRKATIVIEHLIQASDVAHTMQHWHVYRKWNERLFCEMYKAYKEGRSTKDPTDFWYKGEIGFLDHYVIPLAKKLKDCGVFGVSSAEYLSYAEKNRREWEERGEEVVADMIASIQETEREELASSLLASQQQQRRKRLSLSYSSRIRMEI